MRKMFALCSVLLLAGPGCTHQGMSERAVVESIPVPGVDFSKYNTWNFARQGEYVKTGNEVLDDPGFRQSVADHTIAEMKKLGYDNVVEEPDLLLMFHVIVEDRYDEAKANPAYQSYDLAWANVSEDDVWQEGSIILFVVDAKTGSQVWGAKAIGEIDKHATFDTRKTRFKEVVTQMLADFPRRTP
jgi:hypothetical protein